MRTDKEIMNEVRKKAIPALDTIFLEVSLGYADTQTISFPPKTRLDILENILALSGEDWGITVVRKNGELPECGKFRYIDLENSKLVFSDSEMRERCILLNARYVQEVKE